MSSIQQTIRLALSPNCTEKSKSLLTCIEPGYSQQIYKTAKLSESINWIGLCQQCVLFIHNSIKNRDYKYILFNINHIISMIWTELY